MRHFVSVCAVLSLLVACGGGDGSPTTPTGPTTPEPPAPTLSMSAGSVELRGLGATSPLTATLTPSSATLSVSSSNSAIATATSSGTTITVTGVGAGAAQLTVTATNGTKTATSTVAVTVIPIVRQLSLPQGPFALMVGAQQRFTPAVTADAGASTALTWTSSNTAVASVDATGLVLAVAPGAATIRATSVADPALSTSASVVVSAVPRVRAITIAPLNDTLFTGAARQFVANVTADSGLLRTVIWRSSAPAIATVDADGRSVAVAAGTATITALSTADSTMRASAPLVVRVPSVRSVSFTLVTNLVAGTTASAVPTIVADSGADTRVTWTSSVSSVAIVDGTGRVTAVAGGTTAITLRSVAFPSVANTATVTVTNPPSTSSWRRTSAGVGGAITQYTITGIHANSAGDGIVFFDGSAPNIPRDAGAMRMAAGNWIDARSTLTPFTNRFGGQSAGSSPNDVFLAMGANPFGFPAPTSSMVLRWNGSSFEDTNWPTPLSFDSPRARTMASIGVQQVLAVATDGSVKRRTAGAWSTVAGPSTATNARSISAWNADSAVISQCRQSGDGARLSIFSRDTVRVLPNTSLGDPSSVALGCSYSAIAMPGGDILATLDRVVARWSQGTWTAYTPTLADGLFFSAMVRCGGVLYAGTNDSRVFQLIGTQMQQIADIGEAAIDRISTMNCATDGTLRVGSTMGLVSRRTGNGWQDEQFTPGLARTYLNSAESGVAAGRGGLLLRWNGVAWARARRTGVSESFADAWMTSDGRIFGAGSTSVPGTSDRAGLLVRQNGNQWIVDTIPIGSGGGAARSIWGTTATNVFATVAESNTSGKLLRFDGTAWNTVTTTTGALSAMEGSATHALAVGYGGLAMQWDGTAWSNIERVPSPGNVNINKLFVVSPTLAYAGHGDCFTSSTGGLWRWNGQTWSDAGLSNAGFTACVQAVFGTGGNDVFVVLGTATTSYRLVRWDGSAWTQVNGVDVTDVVDGSAVPGLSLMNTNGADIIVGTVPAALRVNGGRKR